MRAEAKAGVFLRFVCYIAQTSGVVLREQNRVRFGRMAKAQKRRPSIRPGEILRADYMEPLALSMNRLAVDLRVPVTRIAKIVHERRGITPSTALRWPGISIP